MQILSLLWNTGGRFWVLKSTLSDSCWKYPLLLFSQEGLMILWCCCEPRWEDYL